jgi:acetyl-CoA C-acetyltransferase
VTAVPDQTPVLVGAGQVVRRDGPWPGEEPVELMAQALLAADRDAGAALLARASGLAVVDPLTWPYRDPVALVADRLRIAPRHRVRTTVGGQLPQQLVGWAAECIARGEHDAVLICGAEAGHSVRAAERADTEPPWPRQCPRVREPERFGGDRDPIAAEERAVGLARPLDYYPLFENALRAAAGRTIEAHTARIARLWSRFSRVARGNPYAWSPAAVPAAGIARVEPDNRLVNFPYPKLMNANPLVDMAAALIVCSAGTARAAGVASDRWVFPWAAAEADDHWHVGHRLDLAASPAIAANARVGLAAAGVGIDQVRYLDLYSCFPSAVQVAASAIGLPDDDPARPLTLTGGLTFAGGPGSNYVGHSLATLLDRLRADPDALGLVTGNGWFLTKHTLGLYGGAPPPRGFRRLQPQAEVDALPGRQVAVGVDGPAALETYTVLHDPGASPRAICSVLLADGRRQWATSADPEVTGALQTRELLGRPVTVRSGALILTS